MSIYKEDGVSSGARNVGRFFLALIPWALAIGALAWMGFWLAVHQYREAVEQDRRRAVYVAAENPPKEKIKIETRKVDCLTVDRADVDGGDITIYGRMDGSCGMTDYTEWHWQALAPDGTVIHEGYENGCPNLRSRGDRAECHMQMGFMGESAKDNRIASVRVWVTKY